MKRSRRSCSSVSVQRATAYALLSQFTNFNRRTVSNADAAMAANSTQSGLPPTFRGYLGKWTNFAGGYKIRWFVLENGILSYYHTQEEEGKQSRGSTNLRFAKIRADKNDKHRFEVIADSSNGTQSTKSSHKLYLRGSHPVERARWVQVLQQSVEYFDVERTPSRAESIRSFNMAKVNDSNSFVPAGTSTPLQVPSRSTTPFRPLSNVPSAAGGIVAPTAHSSAESSMKPSSMISPRSSDAGRLGRTTTSASIMTRDSNYISEDDDDERDLKEAGQHFSGRPRGIPHEKDLPLVSTLPKPVLVNRCLPKLMRSSWRHSRPLQTC
jgi:hypothetical protein